MIPFPNVFHVFFFLSTSQNTQHCNRYLKDDMCVYFYQIINDFILGYKTNKVETYI